MFIIGDLLHSAYRTLQENTDPRLSEWPLMGSPVQILTIVTIYVLYVKILGPSHMSNRKAYHIKPLIIAYNMLMVVANAAFFIIGGRQTYLGGGYSWFCQPPNSGSQAQQMTVITIGYYYMIMKIVELMDTVFFVLTKKFSHISLLHVVHHSLVACTVWLGMNFGATGQNAMFPLINCVIHFIMYGYYAMAALGLQKYLWWKRYLTQIQMLQFIALIVHASIPVFYDCGFRPVFGYIVIFEACLFFMLFLNFYIKTYTKKPLATRGGNTHGASTSKTIKCS
ncbi:elongation of very long chain fatty acids protein AAEL008004-like [Galendromus occidentalis]|uniref:Elongation of very long chain fatty acids protein n=1 Tax=Galendromus occidentalis TaxID=34638 RepID=A0AAJ6VUP0_9ACAR|nr:elongation of very long chain fatty acids protein AAEL008004-like [Galendromus occidentalis]